MNASLPEINTLWAYSKPAQTREKFEKLYSESDNRAGKNYKLELKTQIARTYSLEARFDKAHKILDEVKSQLDEDTKVAEIRYGLERGRTYNSAGEKEKAIELFKESYQLATNLKETLYAVDAAHMIAIASDKLSDKVLWNTKGLHEARNGDDKVKRWVGVFYNNMGWDLFEAGRYQEALEKFQSCWKFHEEKNNEENLSIAKWSYAKTLRKLEDIEKSLQIQLDLLKAKDGVDESGYVFEELGELYLLKGDLGKSRNYFSKAYSILSKDIWLQKNEDDRLERMKGLAGL